MLPRPQRVSNVPRRMPWPLISHLADLPRPDSRTPKVVQMYVAVAILLHAISTAMKLLPRKILELGKTFNFYSPAFKYQSLCLGCPSPIGFSQLPSVGPVMDRMATRIQGSQSRRIKYPSHCHSHISTLSSQDPAAIVTNHDKRRQRAPFLCSTGD